MLGTMRDFDGWDELIEELKAEGELQAIPGDDVLDPDRAAELVAHQLDTRKLIDRCQAEIDQSFEEAARASREQDLVGWLAEELRREHLQGYLEGLERLDSVIDNLVEATPLRPHAFGHEAYTREHYRQRAVDRIARINEGLLRRQAHKDRSGVEN